MWFFCLFYDKIYITMKNNIEQKIEQLTKKLLHHNFEYYNLNQSSISDLEYDQLLNTLAKLEDQYPEFRQPNTPTQNVGGFVSTKFESKQHSTRLYSLQDIFNYDQLYKFDQDIKKHLNDVTYSVELKIDGVAMVLNYQNGYLVSGVTRGDGITGEDVTLNVKTIKSIPQVISNNENIEIRGEVFMSHKSFKQYNYEIKQKQNNAKLKLLELIKNQNINLHINIEEEDNKKWIFWLLEVEQFFKENNTLKENVQQLKELKKIFKEKILANPRNAASGSIRNLDTAITKKRQLDFLPYGTNLQTYQLFTKQNLNSHSKTIDIFTNEFHFNKPNKQIFKNIDEVIKFIENIALKRDTLDYDIDGIVIKVDDITKHDLIGTTAKFPKWAVAYKYPPIPRKSILLDVKYQVGKSGVITPVAIIEPVIVSGSLISRITLHNKAYINENNLCIGDYITVHKSGDVIPQIIANEHTKSSKAIEFIKKCPSCGSSLDFSQIKVMCENDLCSSKISQKIAYFANRNNMDIESLSIKNAQLLVEYGLVSKVLDLYDLNVAKLVLLPRFQEKSAKKLVEQIQQSKSKNLSNLISSLAIKGVGQKNAQYFSKVFNDFKSFEQAIITNDLLLNYLDDISQKIIINIFNYFQLNKDINDQLIKYQINTNSNQPTKFYIDNWNLLKLCAYLQNLYLNASNISSSKKIIIQKQKLKVEENLVLEDIEFKEFNFSKKLKKLYDNIFIKCCNENVVTTEQINKIQQLFVNNNQNLKESMFNDKNIVITGTLINYTRKQLQTILENLGAKVTNSVSKNTNYLIHGKSAGSKLTKATQLQIPLITEEELQDILKKEI